MKPISIPLNTETKKEFDELCETYKLDKQSRLRALYFFEQFLERRISMGNKTPASQHSIYLKIAIFISSQSTVIPSTDGTPTKEPGIRLTSIFRSSTIQ